MSLINVIIPWLGSVWIVTAATMAYWVAHKDQSARPLGAIATLVIAPITALTWFSELPVWWAALVILATAALCLVGMFMPDSKDNWWHYVALVVALFGKAVIAGVVATWGMNVPLLVVIGLAMVIIVLVAMVVRLSRSTRVNAKLAENFDRPEVTVDSDEKSTADPTPPLVLSMAHDELTERELN